MFLINHIQRVLYKLFLSFMATGKKNKKLQK